MGKTLHRSALWCVLAGCLLLLFQGTPGYSVETHYEIGVLAERGKDEAIASWKPTADYLSQALPPNFFSIVPLDYNEVFSAVASREVDFIIADPGMLVELSYFHNIDSMASLKRRFAGQDYREYGGVIFTLAGRKDLQELKDLKGRRLAGAHENSYGGWVLVARELQLAGLNLEHDFSALIFTRNQDDVVRMVLNGKADAGAVRTGVLEWMAAEGKISLADIKVLSDDRIKTSPGFRHSTDLYPEWSIAKLDHVPDEIAKEVTGVLFALTADDPACQAAGLGGWITPLNYSAIRRAYRELNEGALIVSPGKMFVMLLRDYWYLIVVLLFALVYMVMTTIHRSILNSTLKRSKGALEKELTEHKRAEDSLRESRERLQLILDLIPARVFWKDRSSVFQGCNMICAKDGGLNGPEDLIGKTDYDMPWREQAPYYQEDDRRVMDSGTPLYNIVEPQTHADGSVIWLRTNKVPIRDTKGEVVGILGTYEDITEAKRTQEALKRSETKYRELVESASSIILRMNDQGVVTFFNEYAQRFFGFAEDEIIGKSVMGTIVPYVDQRGRDLNRMIEGIVSKTEDFRINENENMRKNGDRVWISWANKTIINENGEREVLCVGTDMTQRRQMEEELLRISYALEQSQNIILMTDIEGNIQYVNPKFSEATGYQREEVLGRNPRILKSGELSLDVYRRLWKTISQGETWRGEFHNRKKSGDLFWERATISPIKDRFGKTINYLAVKEDITQEKRLAQDLQKAFGRLKEMERIINLSNAIVFMWSPSEQIPVKFVSDNIRMLGFEPDDFYLRGLLIPDMILEEDRPGMLATIRRNTEAKRLEFSQQYRVKTADGRIRWFEDHSFVTYTKKGQPEYIQGVAFDITERRIAEERMLEAINMKSEFISIVSHELRTPLTAIKESINIVAEGESGDLNEGQYKFLGIAKRNVDRLGALINDVLDYQKLDMGKLNFEWEDLDIRPLVLEVVKTMDIVAQNKGLRLEVDLPQGEIPKVHIDAGRIIQVLNNLLNNAIKFTEHGLVRVELKVHPASVQVLVKDTGIGIKAQDMHKLFQTFSQVRTGSERRSGETGLGLAISKKIIDSHGGSIWAESVFGEGSVFTFTLPVKGPV